MPTPNAKVAGDLPNLFSVRTLTTAQNECMTCHTLPETTSIAQASSHWFGALAFVLSCARIKGSALVSRAREPIKDR